jgi:fumarylacetoacetase
MAKKQSWVEVAESSDFPIQNLPFGIFKTESLSPRVCSAIGDYVIDLSACLSLGYLDHIGLSNSILMNKYLNDFISLGKEKTRAVRSMLAEVLTAGNNAAHKSHKFLHKMSEVQMLMPIQIGDYTDFYSSIEHATNVGTMFRDPENALLPNWKHLPVGYHGRASSIVVSGTPIKRPSGQTIPADSSQPVFGPTKLLDFELEMGFVIGKNTELGQQVKIEDAEDYIFGLILLNDWSARDIQKWEYVPLGPFLAKNFASTVSAWVVTLDALEECRVDGPIQEPKVLPYLQYEGQKNYDINLEVSIKTPEGVEKKVCRSNFKYMYWNMCQQLAHHTVNGCNIRVGDMYASGTISGPTPESYGSMLELSWRGTKPIPMPDGSVRKFINDGDSVVMRGWGNAEGARIGFGECLGKVE